SLPGSLLDVVDSDDCVEVLDASVNSGVGGVLPVVSACVEEPVDLDVSEDYPNEVLREGQPNEGLILILSKVLRNQRYPYERNTKDSYFTRLSQDGIAQSRLSVSKAVKIVLIDS